MSIRKNTTNRSVDLHGLTLIEAKEVLDKFMNGLPQFPMEVTVIHGFHYGIRLKTFVSQYKHPRISKKIKTMNRGETIFVCH
jgi:DNA-nicking Smr family endonuclease